MHHDSYVTRNVNWGIGDRRKLSQQSGAETQQKSTLVHCSFNMTFDGNILDYFPENQLTKLAHLVQFKTCAYILSEELRGPGNPCHCRPYQELYPAAE